MYPIVHQLFGHLHYHPKGTHRKLKGVDADGRYLTAATENYSTGTNRLVARCVHWRLFGTIAGVCESEYEHMPSLIPEADLEDEEDRLAELAAITGTTSSPTSESLSLPPGLRRRDVAATSDDVDAHVTLDAGSFGLVAGVIRGKHLARHAVTHDFLHNVFDLSEARVLRFRPDALCDAEVWWSTVIVEKPCEACITGDVSRLVGRAGLCRAPRASCFSTYGTTPSRTSSPALRRSSA